MREETVAILNIGQQKKTEHGYRLFSAQLTEFGKNLPGGYYEVIIKPVEYKLTQEDMDRINVIRHVTGLGLMQCRKALINANGNVSEAIRIAVRSNQACHLI